MDDASHNTPAEESARIEAVKKWEKTSEIELALKWTESIKAAFVSINEYWNGDRNDQAMFDACNHNEEISQTMLDDFAGFEKVIRNLVKRAKDNL